MNHIKLKQRSEMFVDDTLERVDKRCFLLLCGAGGEIDSALSIDIGVNIFDDPAIKRKV